MTVPTHKTIIEEAIVNSSRAWSSQDIVKAFGLRLQHASAILKQIEQSTTHHCISSKKNNMRVISLSKTRVPFGTKLDKRDLMFRQVVFGIKPDPQGVSHE